MAEGRTSVEDLRREQSFARHVEAAWRLCDHPECTWGDLVELTGDESIVSEYAGFRLCAALSVLPIPGVLFASREVWRLRVVSAGKGLDERVVGP